MTQLLVKPNTDFDLIRKSEIYSILDEICQDLELTGTQAEAARASYEAVGAWLSASEDPLLQRIEVYAHGSAGLGTTVRPLGREDFDVDLICLVSGFTANRSPAELKKIVGDRMLENDRYAGMLEEKKRCWRLNYAREYHLDISPTIRNVNCSNGGELVPDKQLREFKPTNPKGYTALFNRRAGLRPTFKLRKKISVENQASVAPFPTHGASKGGLRRAVQLLKRHRDVHFLNFVEDIAPISIIITTLTAKSYEFCVNTFQFDSEFDVLVATIRLMPHFIERPYENGRRNYLVPNETTEGENFAERWNSEPERARAFYEWHSKALADFESIAELEGLDVLTMALSKSLGESVVMRVMTSRTDSISKARVAQKLYVAPAIGLTTTSSLAATVVPKHTYFGDKD